MTKTKPMVSVATFGIENDKVANERHRNEQGLGWIITSLFVVGDLAGGGIIALPSAIVQTSKILQIFISKIKNKHFLKFFE